jgi:hypothetical protein
LFIILKIVKLFDISKTISYNSLGRIYKPASTLKDSLENRLKREGYVEGIVENNKHLHLLYSIK